MKINIDLFIKNAPQISSDMFVAPHIPEKKLSKAVKAYGVRNIIDSIVALYDNTLFGSAKEGLIFTDEKVFYREMFSDPIELIYDNFEYVKYVKNVITTEKGKEKINEYINVLFKDDSEVRLGGLINCNYEELASFLTKLTTKSEVIQSNILDILEGENVVEEAVEENVVKDLSEEEVDFPTLITGHPVSNLSLEEKILYVQGVGIAVAADQSIHKKERKYLTKLIEVIDLDESMIEDVLSFIKEPDREIIQEIFTAFSGSSTAQILLFNSLEIMLCDDEYTEEEQSVFSSLHKKLALEKEVIKDVISLNDAYKSGEVDRAYKVINSGSLAEKTFGYLIDEDHCNKDCKVLDNEKEQLKQSVCLTQLKEVCEKIVVLKKQADLSNNSTQTEPSKTQFKKKSLEKIIEEKGDGYLTNGKTVFSTENDWFGSSDKFTKKAVNALWSYVAGNDEDQMEVGLFEDKTFMSVNDSDDRSVSGSDVLVLVDSTLFGSAEDGILITNNKLYSKDFLNEPWSIALDKIKTVKLRKGDCELKINSHYIGYAHSELNTKMTRLSDCLTEYVKQNRLEKA
jgi:uncharacterized tellurite resistance protein B-like protein